MQTNLILRANKFLAKFISLPRYQIRMHLAEFALITGEGDYVLDLGCGMDTPYKPLFSHHHYLGIDMFERATLQADITKVPITSNIADLVILTEVLEHVPEPKSVLLEICRLLKPGKFLVLTVPLLWGEHDYVDYQRWTESGLRKLIDSSGFEILQIEKRGAIFSAAGCVLSQAPNQIFGRYLEQKNIIFRGLYLLLVPFFMIIPWLFSLFDIFDRSQKFVVGYSVLAIKK